MNLIALENFFNTSELVLLLLGTVIYWLQALFGSFRGWALGRPVMIGANLLALSTLLSRWFNGQHVPLSNRNSGKLKSSRGYWFAILILLHVILETQPAHVRFGAITAPTALMVNGFANFCLPDEMQRTGPLVPALQSHWLTMHVTMMLCSYATLLFGCLFSIAFLVVYGLDRRLTTPSNLITASVQTPSNLLEALDSLSYRLIGAGFPLLTLGILSGAVWANQAWGAYWSWDPKETWALVTWLTFAIYLHTRLITGWAGIRPARIASFGFIIVWVCYLGVNILGKGLHAYGWIVSG
uniref:Cytochrome c biogenesis protein CcsA n=1 Tax=Pseudobryopsis hainanensis TaxID=2320808 RepID=A0A3S5WZY2_9CHLO|nr:cytochrome c biogenesis protein Ccs1 [Pseudobryopsis hainanensis]